MILSKFKTLFCIAAGFTLLFAPLALEISPDGNAYAGILSGGGGGGNGGNGGSGGTTISDTGAPTAAAPEPATLLLFGAGAVGLVAYRKYKKNK